VARGAPAWESERGTSDADGELPESDEGGVDVSDSDDTGSGVVGNSIPPGACGGAVATTGSFSEENFCCVADGGHSKSIPMTPFCQRKEPTNKRPRKRRKGIAQNDNREGADGTGAAPTGRSVEVVVQTFAGCNSDKNCVTAAFVSIPKKFV
jgi:hypothetical protein